MSTEGSAAVTGTPAPLLRVVKGDPTPEELAALIAVVASRGGGAPAPVAVRAEWGRPVLRSDLPSGPGAWRRSALPR